MRNLVVCLLAAVLGLPLFAQVRQRPRETSNAGSPIPEQIHSAKTVFLSNLGADPVSLSRLAPATDEPFASFYAAMKSWGHYRIVTNPAIADLVLELRTASGLDDAGKFGAGPIESEFLIQIVDPHTHFTLWTVSEPIAPAALKGNWRKNLESSVNAAIDELKALTSSQSGG